jgi:nucleoside phosphorylase
VKRIQIISSGNQEIFPFAHPIGIGIVESAINLTRLILFDRPDFIIFIGSAGSYGKLKPFEIIKTKTASNIEQCFLKEKCYTPIDNIITQSVSRETIINSSNYITTSKKISKKYLSIGIDAENMEFFSIMKVSKEFEIPAVGIFVITNYCYKNAHNEYKQNIKKAKKTLIEYLKKEKIIKEING